MARHTFLLILCITIISASLIGTGASLSYNKLKNASLKTPSNQQTSLALKPNPLYVLTTEKNASPSAVNIQINTKKNKVTAVQLELSYDPTLLTDVNIIPGPFFTSPSVLLKEIKNGTILYSLGVAPGSSGKKGKGIIATVTFRINSTKSTITPLLFLPKTMVAADGETKSVLKSAKELLIYINKGIDDSKN